MTTKKIVIIIGGVIVVIILMVALFAAAIIGFAFYSIGNSEAAATAKNFLRENEKLKQDIGEVKDFGSFITGSVNVDNSNGSATLNLKVIGQRKTVNSTVQLMYTNGREWRVTGASYKNDAGQTVDLLDAFEGLKFIPPLVA